MTGNVLRMKKPIPDSESDRCLESVDLIAKLKPEDMAKLTTWEVGLVEDLSVGKACTKIRLKELRECIERIYPNETRT
jgi:uncharacterized protein YqfB (UPF0267 family)